MQHLDEGTIHAWLDGQLPRDEALEVEAHVAECRQCADAVAEARGLIAASSRILTALDSVPREVVPKQPSFRAAEDAARAQAIADAAADALVPLGPVTRRAHRRWFNGASLAAAATIVVAIGTVTVMQRSGREVGILASKPASPASATSGSFMDSAASVATAPTPQTAPTPSPTATGSLGDARRAIVDRPVAAAPSNARDEREASNEAARRAASDSAVERVAVAREAELRPPSGTPAASPTGAFRARSVLQRADTTANKPVDQLAKDTKQEVPAAQAAQQQIQVPRRDAMGARIATPDTARADRSKQVAADAAAGAGAAGVIKGRVTDANNTGLSNVTVNVAGTSTGVATNAAGEFTIEGLQGGTYQLTVRRVGFQPVEREITVAGGQTIQTDVVLNPAVTELGNVVVTGAAGSQRQERAGKSKAPSPAPAPPAGAPPGAPITAAQSDAVGCYELGITALTPTRNTFAGMPRRVALDSEIVPANADGVWYRARDLARTNVQPNGLWRPAGPNQIELEWTYGSRTARVHVSGPPGSMMRGNLEEIDRARATGEAAAVVAIRRTCEP